MEKSDRSRLSAIIRFFSPGRVRWEPLPLLVAGAAILISVLWNREADDRTTQIVYVYYVIGWSILLTAMWWVLISGFRWQTRLWGIVLAASTVGLGLGVFRHEGFTGDFIPIFSLRWDLTAEQRAVDYFESQSTEIAGENAESEPLVETAEDWPQFRGPERTGHVRGVTIRRDWDETPPRLLWKHPVGSAWSSFAVIGNRAFTQEQRGAEEIVVCYDLQTGSQIWVHADETRFENALGGNGPRATPTFFAGRLYTLGATGILNCLEPRTGKLIWQRNIVEDAGSTVTQFGMSTSPFIHENLVLVNAGGDQGRGVAAYDRETGEIVWAHGERKAGYASPVRATFAGLEQLLIFGAHGLAGHDAQTGEELWWFDWKNNTSNNCAAPILLDDGTIFLSTGYGQGTALLEVNNEGGKWSATPIRWKTSKRFKLKISGGLLKDGYVYGLDENILCCFDPATGKRKWKRGRFGYGQILLVDDLILVSTETGKVALVEANPERYKRLASFQAIEGKTWNHPVLCRGLLLVRNDEEAACYDLRPVSEAVGAQ